TTLGKMQAPTRVKKGVVKERGHDVTIGRHGRRVETTIFEGDAPITDDHFTMQPSILGFDFEPSMVHQPNTRVNRGQQRIVFLRNSPIKEGIENLTIVFTRVFRGERSEPTGTRIRQVNPRFFQLIGFDSQTLSYETAAQTTNRFTETILINPRIAGG